MAAAGLAVAGRVSAQSVPADAPSVARYPELSRINLAGNENPFGPSRRVAMALMREIPNSCRYPFREEVILKERIAAQEGVEPECVTLGNGCDEILSLAGAVYGRAGSRLVATRPTYLQLMSYAEKQGAEIAWVDHQEGSMRHDLAAMELAIDERTTLAYVCNPDTPTGTVLPPGELAAFCRTASSRCAVFVDEVYLDLVDSFRADTQVGLVKKGLPVIIGRSFSKMHGLAGHRVGYAIARPDIAKALEEGKMSSLSYLGVAAAIASLDDAEFHERSRRLIREGREHFCSLLDELGLQYIPSVGNFVFHHTGIGIREFQELMKERNFLVGRPFPPYDDWCRVSIGSPQEMRSYEAAMREVFARRALDRARRGGCAGFSLPGSERDL